MNYSLVDIVLAPLKYGVNIDGIEHGANSLITNRSFANYTLLSFTKIFEKAYNEKTKYLNTVFLANKKIYKTVKSVINVGNFPLVIGGDHSIAIGSIAAASEYADNLGVIWIDAHGDMNTEETTISGNIHGMPLAVLQGLGNKKLTNFVQKKIKTENIVVFGTRDLDEKEEKLMESIGLNYFSFANICKNGFEKSFNNAIDYLKKKTDRLHISFDLDSMNPEIIKGVSTPVPDGFKSEEVEYMINNLFMNFLITSMDIVEYNPKFDTNGETMLELIKIINIVYKNKTKVSHKEKL